MFNHLLVEAVKTVHTQYLDARGKESRAYTNLQVLGPWYKPGGPVLGWRPVQLKCLPNTTEKTIKPLFCRFLSPIGFGIGGSSVGFEIL